MSIEQALIQRAQPRLVEHKLKELIAFESHKGCISKISPFPVRLEPCFLPISELNRVHINAPVGYWEPDERTDEREWARLSIWTSEDQEPDWQPLERFVKQLGLLSYRVGFEIAGNSNRIATSLLVHRRDLPVISVVFESEFEFCKLLPIDGIFPHQSDKRWAHLIFKDFYPTPPYSELLTRPMELHYSPLRSLVLAMAKIRPPAIGFYQVLTQAVQAGHNWHRNVEILKDLQFNAKLHGNYSASKSYSQQSPSGDLKMMAWEIENKAHNDKPFYCVAVRVGVFDNSDNGSQALNTVTAAMGLFQHGGRPLNFISEVDYKTALHPHDVQRMFFLGLTYRPGFLINSLEHTGFIHFLFFQDYAQREIPIRQLDKLQVKNTDLTTGNGTIIGTAVFAETRQSVSIPEHDESKSKHIIGKPGVGKSTLIRNMALNEIERGNGVAIIEPHNDLTNDILERIPEKHMDRVIYFDPGDLDFVPLFNPLDRMLLGQDIGRSTDNIVQGIKSFVSSTGWGARTEHLFRNIIFSLLHVPNSTFFDVSSLLRNDSNESKAFSKKILEVIENETARQFWKNDYLNLKRDELGPPRNKMSQLLLSGTPALMLSQPDNRINFRKIMDEGYILLVNLANVGTILRGVLGCFILSQFHIAALARSRVPAGKRKLFNIYVDEAHRFMTDTIEDMIAETRKYNVSLNIAHQNLNQFDKGKIDALSNVGSTIIFNVGKNDAVSLSKGLGSLVDPDDIISLKVGEAIARIGTDVVRIETIKMPPASKQNCRDRIIAASKEKYYRSLVEVKRRIKTKKSTISPIVPSVIANADPGEFVYDVFS